MENLHIWLTIAATHLLAVLGYATVELFIKPLSVYSHTKNKIAAVLHQHSNILTSPSPDNRRAIDASDELRVLAMELEVVYLNIRFRNLFNLLRLTPNDMEVLEAKRSLVFLSNSTISGDSRENHIHIGVVHENLRIYEIDKTNSAIAIKNKLEK